MNGALQTQLGLNFAPALTLVYDHTAAGRLFSKISARRTCSCGEANCRGDTARVESEPRIIAPSTGYKLPVGIFSQIESTRVPKGGSEKLHCYVFLKTANGKTTILPATTYYLNGNTRRYYNYTQQIGIKLEGW